MVDVETYSRRLEALDSYLHRARRLAEVAEQEFLADPAIHDLAERYLHLAVEAALDLANHWIAERGLRTPESNRDTFAVLEEAGEIDRALGARLRGWAGFRNVLVHEYTSIDHRLAYRAIHDDLPDLEALRDWALAKLESEA